MDTGRIRSLAGVDLLQGLPAHTLQYLEGNCRWLSVKPQQVVVGHLDQGTDVFFVVEGTLRAHIYSAGGQAILFRDISTGEPFGDLSAIDGQPRSASEEALTKAFVAAMPADRFRALLLNEPIVAERQLASLVGMVRQLSERVYEFSALAVKSRLHAELLRLAQQQDHGGNIALLRPSPTHAELASKISTHREAVTRELRVLAMDGLVERKGRSLLIKDLAALKQLVESVSGAESG